MALLAERLAADEALQWGLIDRVVDDAELAATAEALVMRLAAGPTQAYAAIKQAINAGVLGGLPAALDREATLQGQRAASADFAEGTAAFLERRPARFTGR
jgi:2-(1,2-epoxy-1,2-dihydrophenyl)acetyl-CoA isomerase